MGKRLKIALATALAVLAMPAEAASYIRYDFLTQGQGTHYVVTNGPNGSFQTSTVGLDNITFSALIAVGAPFITTSNTISLLSEYTFAANPTSLSFGLYMPGYRGSTVFGVTGCFPNGAGNAFPTASTNTILGCGSANLDILNSNTSGAGYHDLYSGFVTSIRVSTVDFTPVPGVGNVSFLYAAGVPEPSTWVMLIIGFGMMGASMRCRHRSTKAAYA